MPVILSGEKLLFLPENETIVISDLHIGKGAHFRKAGIPVPSGIENDNYKRLEKLLLEFPAKQLIILGDMFHSVANTETDFFLNWRKSFPEIEFVLVRGNHDLYSSGYYNNAGIKAVEELAINELVFTHHPKNEGLRNNFNIYGHLHPGIRLKGMLKGVYNKVPCFCIGSDSLCMPSFGSFTGTSEYKEKQGDVVFGIVNQKLFKISL